MMLYLPRRNKCQNGLGPLFKAPSNTTCLPFIHNQYLLSVAILAITCKGILLMVILFTVIQPGVGIVFTTKRGYPICAFQAVFCA